MKITVNDNGSYLVDSEESVEIVGSDGAPIPHKDGRFWLCRCGGSGNKPFCDATHLRNGFESVIEVQPPPAPQP